eukprot:scaffold4927_cov139-Amphora_coffeaeformis.AAC.16
MQSWGLFSKWYSNYRNYWKPEKFLMDILDAVLGLIYEGLDYSTVLMENRICRLWNGKQLMENLLEMQSCVP